MITLGIDPGTARLGFGVIDSAEELLLLLDFGTIETGSQVPMPDRLLILHDCIVELITQHRPNVIAVEQLFFARNVTTALSVGQARGVVLLAAARAGIKVEEYSPSQIKHAVAGYGKADKPQMQEMVRMLLELDSVPQPDDAADALAVALCHIQHSGFAARVAESE